jgi:hypothetical protein
LGWFGVFMMLIAINLSTLGVSNTNLVFLQALEMIMLVFIIIVLTKKNYAAVT